MSVLRSPQGYGGDGPTKEVAQLNQKVRQLALRSALSYHAVNGQLKVVDSIACETPKTKLFQEMLTKLGISGKTLVVAKDFTDNEY